MSTIVAIKFGFGNDDDRFGVCFNDYTTFKMVIDSAFFNETVCILDNESDSWIEWVSSNEIVFENSL